MHFVLHYCRVRVLVPREGGLSPGGPEGGEGAANTEGDELSGRDIKCPGGEAAVGGRPDGQLAPRLVVQDLSGPLRPTRLKLHSIGTGKGAFYITD